MPHEMIVKSVVGKGATVTTNNKRKISFKTSNSVGTNQSADIPKTFQIGEEKLRECPFRRDGHSYY